MGRFETDDELSGPLKRYEARAENEPERYTPAWYAWSASSVLCVECTTNASIDEAEECVYMWIPQRPKNVPEEEWRNRVDGLRHWYHDMAPMPVEIRTLPRATDLVPVDLGRPYTGPTIESFSRLAGKLAEAFGKSPAGLRVRSVDEAGEVYVEFPWLKSEHDRARVKSELESVLPPHVCCQVKWIGEPQPAAPVMPTIPFPQLPSFPTLTVPKEFLREAARGSFMVRADADTRTPDTFRDALCAALHFGRDATDEQLLGTAEKLWQARADAANETIAALRGRLARAEEQGQKYEAEVGRLGRALSSEQDWTAELARDNALLRGERR